MLTACALDRRRYGPFVAAVADVRVWTRDHAAEDGRVVDRDSRSADHRVPHAQPDAVSARCVMEMPFERDHGGMHGDVDAGW